MGFTTFGLSDQVLQGVHASGYTVPTPIQALALRPATEGRDIIGSAQTGTGKTAAFVLPMLHRLSAKNGSLERHVHPRALVLTPTRELAQQVQDAVTTYGRFLDLRSGSIYGGVGMQGQVKMLRRGVDIVIATPGRLLDHMQQKTIDLKNIQVFVLDEADRMLGMGFIDDVRKIVARVPKERQTMLFSATISDDVNSLASQILRNPHSVEAGHHRKPVETITQNFYVTATSSKMDLLHHVLKSEKLESVLVFSRTKRGADKISQRLERSGIASTAIHSNRTQPQRMKALEGFKQGRFRVLVATDIAARGIDVDGISHVINYDIPRDAEDYVHRIGRTGRAGASGDAITFVSGEDRDALRRIERFAGIRCNVQSYPGFTPPERPSSPAQSQGPGVHKRKKEAGHFGGHSPERRNRSYSRPQTSEKRDHSHLGAHPSERQNHNRVGAFPAGKANHKRFGGKKRGKTPFVFGKKKKSFKKMESFSSDGGWSNR